MLYDLIVVGAGTGGSVAAKAAAARGFTVCMVDREERSRIGDKVCGEAVGKHHFDNLGIDPPDGEELAGRVVGIDLYSPDQETLFRVRGEGLHGFMINRRAFGQRLLNEALDAGVEFCDRTVAVAPLFDGGYVVGVRAHDIANRRPLELHGKVVVDASGMAGAIRQHLPEGWGVERTISDRDYEVCYRELRTIDGVEDPEFLRIYFNQRVAPGGYTWIFPKGDGLANVGLGVKGDSAVDPKAQLYDHVLSLRYFQHSRLLEGRRGVVPTRRPMDSMVGNGVLCVGDAAFQPNPVHGGGIGPSLIAGTLAARVAGNAIDADDVSIDGLWAYNQEYMVGYGAKAAGLDVFRRFLQTCLDDDLNYGMTHRLIKEEDILMASLGEDLKLNVTEQARRALRGAGRLSLLQTLRKTADAMTRVKGLYRAYPRRDGLPAWSQHVTAVMRGTPRR
jgi:geranylgeranyl reductase family protein